ncbi:abortive infection protein [Lacticaseibacillus casei]|nr:abortive infection protein [Lacticaseibacillus casei]
MNPYANLSPHKIANRINKAADSLGVPRQNMQLLFRLQELLRQISESDYQDNFIFKGGFEIAMIVGASRRTTIDLDMTMNNQELNPDNLKKVLTTIFDHAQSPIHFTVTRIKSEMNEHEYPGFRVGVLGTMGKTHSKLNIDVSTGDVVYPKPVRLTHTNFIDSTDKILMNAFPQEQIMADKLVTIYQKGIRNTRAKDFYDIWVLSLTTLADLNHHTLVEAFFKTAKAKGITDISLKQGKEIIEQLKARPDMVRSWQGYQETKEFARGIELNQALDNASEQLKNIFDDNTPNSIHK